MTKEEAFDKLVEATEAVGSGKYPSLECAYVEAARALNYIMDNIDGSENTTTD